MPSGIFLFYKQMAKTKTQKKELVADYVAKLDKVNTIYFVKPLGLGVNQTTMLKKALYGHNTDYHIVKNTLFKIALEQKGLPVPSSLDNGENAVVFCSDEVSEIAKLIKEHAKETEKLSILGGILNGELISGDQVEALASLPSKDQLLGQLLSVFNGPMRGLVTVLSGNMREFVQVLSAIQDKKSEA